MGFVPWHSRWIFHHPSRGRLAHLAHLHAESYVSAQSPLSLLFLIPRTLIAWSQRWYMEDCERLSLLRPLKGLELHPMELVVSLLRVLAFALTLPAFAGGHG